MSDIRSKCGKLLMRDYELKCPRCKEVYGILGGIAEAIKAELRVEADCQKSEFVCDWIDVAVGRLAKKST